MGRTKYKRSLLAFLLLLVIPALAVAQSDRSGEDGIGIAPTRFELPMMPGTEKTVVVNVIYNSVSGEAEPCRLVAYLGDWSILKNGDTEFYRAGSQPGSASPWLIYSPGEVTAIPGKVHPIRVTISVPKDATPGDHLAALFVESRPDNIKLDKNRRQVVLRFRMTALFYIMVPQLTRKGSLENLTAGQNENGIVVTPTLKNSGNSHLRPVHSIRIIDSAGAVVADLPPRESLPVLGDSEMSPPLLIEKSLPPGSYSVRYRVDFKDGTPITEGQADLIIKPPASETKQTGHR
ncbi:MAG TPA: hypothetical protein VFQ92_17380 [Blastocatellia bacterium]|nr:hypothetical protein [Blastocatellia bacterium]